MVRFFIGVHVGCQAERTIVLTDWLIHIFGLLNPFQFGQHRTKHAQDSSFSNRNWRVTSYQDLRPGVDTVEAPQWTLNNHYYPPPNQHYTSTNINAKKDGVFSFLPDISLPKFDKIFADLRVKRNS